MNYLVGDIGNTLTKICLIKKNSKISREYSIETKKLLLKKNMYNFFLPILKMDPELLLLNHLYWLLKT